MDREELRGLVRSAAVVRGRTASPGAFVRGWHIDSSRVLSDPAATAAAARLVDDLVGDVASDIVAGIERAGVPLARALAALTGSRVVGVDVRHRRPGLTHRPGGESAVPEPPARRAILVDDVVNSGRTARIAMRRLRACGVEVVAVACLVRYPKTRPALLARWPGPLVSVFSLEDLSLRRFMIGASPK